MHRPLEAQLSEISQFFRGLCGKMYCKKTLASLLDLSSESDDSDSEFDYLAVAAKLG
jgi:hypothetical protein